MSASPEQESQQRLHESAEHPGRESRTALAERGGMDEQEQADAKSVVHALHMRGPRQNTNQETT